MGKQLALGSQNSLAPPRACVVASCVIFMGCILLASWNKRANRQALGTSPSLGQKPAHLLWCREAFVLARNWALRFLHLVNPEAQLLQTSCKESTLKVCEEPISATAAAPSVPGNSKTSFQ